MSDIAKALAVALTLLGTGSAAEAATVRVRDGNVVYRRDDGRQVVMTRERADSEPVLSPDGAAIVFIRDEGKATRQGGSGATALWACDVPAANCRRILGPQPSQDPERDLSNFRSPKFSLTGGFVYLLAAAWETSDALHQVNLKTGGEKFITDGNKFYVIRSGRYRGCLLVQRHTSRKRGGSSDPVFVISPDGRQTFMVPGSDLDGGRRSAMVWLRNTNATAY